MQMPRIKWGFPHIATGANGDPLEIWVQFDAREMLVIEDLRVRLNSPEVIDLAFVGNSRFGEQIFYGLPTETALGNRQSSLLVLGRLHRICVDKLRSDFCVEDENEIPDRQLAQAIIADLENTFGLEVVASSVASRLIDDEAEDEQMQIGRAMRLVYERAMLKRKSD